MARTPGSEPTTWVLADDRAGNRAQCLGVAEALGWPFTVKEIRYGGTVRLPNHVLGASFAALTAASRATMTAPWPGLVIAAGRRTAPVARAIKRRSRGQTFLVQLMNPDGGDAAFDLIAVPRHDRHRPAANVIETLGAPHRASVAMLARAGKEWAPRLAGLPRPRVALLVGGITKKKPFTDQIARDLAATACCLASSGSLMVSTSRRTGEAADDLIAALSVPSFVYRWNDGGENPYFGFLAHADAIIVSGDSMSMCSEACATRAPVYIYAPPGYATAKHLRLHQALYAGGYARPLGSRLERWTHPPLNPAAEVAAEIVRRMNVASARPPVVG